MNLLWRSYDHNLRRFANRTRGAKTAGSDALLRLATAVLAVNTTKVADFSGRNEQKTKSEEESAPEGRAETWCWRPRRDLNPCYRRERAVS